MIARVQVIAVIVKMAATSMCFVADQQIETEMLSATPTIRSGKSFARDQLILKSDVYVIPKS